MTICDTKAEGLYWCFHAYDPPWSWLQGVLVNHCSSRCNLVHCHMMATAVQSTQVLPGALFDYWQTFYTMNTAEYLIQTVGLPKGTESGNNRRFKLNFLHSKKLNYNEKVAALHKRKCFLWLSSPLLVTSCSHRGHMDLCQIQLACAYLWDKLYIIRNYSGSRCCVIQRLTSLTLTM